MAALLSPGILVQEKDFSQIVPSVSSSVGGMVGRFTKGPIETPILISSEDQLVKVFGTPNDTNANEWHTVAEFLKYTNACWVVRSRNSGIANAVSTGVNTVAVVNRNEYESITTTQQTNAGEFIAKNPGTVGNGIGVIMVDASTWSAFNAWCNSNLALFPNSQSLAAQFSSIPSTSAYVANLSQDTAAKDDEIHVLIIDITGAVSGIPYTVLERYEGLSKASDAVNYQGLTTYYVNVLNESSQYVWWSKFPTATSGSGVISFGGTGFDSAPIGTTFAQISISASPNFFNQTLSGGVNGTSSTLANIEAAYDTLTNKDLYSVDLFMCGAFSVGLVGDVERYVVENIVGSRLDCVAFVSPHTNGSPIKDSSTAAQTVAAFKASCTIPDQAGSYGFMETGMKYIYDRYSKKYRYVPMNGDMAGLAARTDNTNDPWWSFAGFNRGGIKNVIKFAYNPGQADRDYLYPKGINPCVMDASSGPTLLGDRTMTTKPSAFDRINVRRLFIVLEKAISKASKYQMFEFNDSFTQAQFKNMVEPFLKGVKGRRGITDFMVRCDSTNNTGDVVDRNEFIAEIYIKPARSINFITLSFVATRSDVAFSTVVGA
jgi:phage tail sheath protein FI